MKKVGDLFEIVASSIVIAGVAGLVGWFYVDTSKPMWPSNVGAKNKPTAEKEPDVVEMNKTFTQEGFGIDRRSNNTTIFLEYQYDDWKMGGESISLIITPNENIKTGYDKLNLKDYAPLGSVDLIEYNHERYIRPTTYINPLEAERFNKADMILKDTMEVVGFRYNYIKWNADHHKDLGTSLDSLP